MAEIAKLEEFVAWSKKHISGDEKGEAQIFLDRLFQAFGQPGLLEVGGKPEFRIKKAAEDGQGTSFADFVWKPHVLIEMKKRGEPLSKHFKQACQYWTRLVPDRPNYVVLCNFDTFVIYDFNKDVDDPVDEVSLLDLPSSYQSLNFLSPGNFKPRFKFDREAVTREAADILASVYQKLINPARNPKITADDAQRFILQCLVCLFSEDIGLLPKTFFTTLLEETSPEESFDDFGNLFRSMNNKKGNTGGRFKDVPYFNGGLFKEPASVELLFPELLLLRKASSYNWSKVSPDIFGTLFQDSIDKSTRHALGAHYTTSYDIMKIIRPTIEEPWDNLIVNSETKEDLIALLKRLSSFTVLDPACGSGNFLYTAYRTLRRLETKIRLKLKNSFNHTFKSTDELSSIAVKCRNFYGFDLLPFAVELAKITLVIGKKLSIDELHDFENALPLDNLDKNIQCHDALIDLNGNIFHWPKCDVIIGNPPYLGSKKLKVERGPDYVNRIRKAYKEVPGMADYCVYWFSKANEILDNTTKDNIVGGRAGLVGTSNIRYTASRKGGLDKILETGTIVDAVDNQKWSGDAAVYVSIVNWVKSKDESILPKNKNLWLEIKNPDKSVTELTLVECLNINSSLSKEVSLSEAHSLECNKTPKLSYQGQTVGHDAFVIDERKRFELISKDSSSSLVIFPYLNGQVLLTDIKTRDFVIDFQDMAIEEASKFKEVFAYVKKTVLPDREKKAESGKTSEGKRRSHHVGFLKKWWQHSFPRPELISKITKLDRYLACSIGTKRPLFVFVSPQIRPSNLVQVFCLQDDYSFGVLTSNVFWEWFKGKSSKLGGTTPRYGDDLWNSFPWPQNIDESSALKVASISRDIQQVRSDYISSTDGGLRRLYQSIETPGDSRLKELHFNLNKAVMDLYGIHSENTIYSKLLALNNKIFSKIKNKEAVNGPGLPLSFNQKDFISNFFFSP